MEQDKTVKKETSGHLVDFNLEIVRNPGLENKIRAKAAEAVALGSRIDSIIALSEISSIGDITGKDGRFFRDRALDKISDKLKDKSLSKPEIIELREIEAKTALRQALEPEDNFDWRSRLSDFANNQDPQVEINEKTRCELRKLAHGATDTVWTSRIRSITHNQFTGKENDLYSKIMPIVTRNGDGSRTPYSYYAQAVEATIDAEMRKSTNPDYKPVLESMKERYSDASYDNHTAYLKSLKQITPEIREALSEDAEYRTKLAERFMANGEYHKAESLMDKLANNDKIRALRTRNYLFMAEEADATPENAAKYIREAMTSSVALADIPVIGGEGIGKYTRNMADKYPGQPDLIRPLHILEARNFLGRTNPDTEAADKKIKEALGAADDFDLSDTEAFMDKTGLIEDKKVRQSIMLAGIEYFWAKSKPESTGKSSSKFKGQISALSHRLQSSFMESYAEKDTERRHDNLRLDIADTLNKVWDIQIDAGCDTPQIKESIESASDALRLNIPEIPAVKKINDIEDIIQQEAHKSEQKGKISRIIENLAGASTEDLNYALGHAEKIDKDKLKDLTDNARTRIDITDGNIKSNGIEVIKLIDAYMIHFHNARADEKEIRNIPGLINSILPLAQTVYAETYQDENISQKIARIIVELNNARDVLPAIKKGGSFFERFLKRRS